MCLPGAEDYATEIWLAASTDPAVPRLAVLVPPHMPSLVKVHLQRALTEVPVMGVAVLLSPGLTLTGITDLAPVGPPAPRFPSSDPNPLEAPAL